MGIGWRSKTLGSERGSAAVLLTTLLSCLVLLAAVLFAASKEATSRSVVDASLQLAGRSVLSEYDRRLFSDYGLLAFRGDGARMEADIAFYADASLRKDKTAYAALIPHGVKPGVFDCAADAVAVNLKEYSIVNVDLFEARIGDIALSSWARDKAGGSGEDAASPGAAPTDRTLRNRSVTESLPSNGLSGISFPDLASIRIPTWAEISDKAIGTARTSEYILSVFKHANGGSIGREGFFENEVEYILSGKMNDDANYRSVRTKLSLLRFILNNTALLADRNKMASVKAAAAPFAAAFGVGEVAAEAIIVEAWVIAETRNDLLLLEDGKKVALTKSADMWATQDIEKILEGVTSDEAVSPANPGGQSYEDYLRILLFLTDRETKLLRAMDLIQINLKGTYDRAFQLREYYVGFRFDATVNGKTYAYTERYGRGNLLGS
ncbi:MAG: DUF5702 domain-containing protein [Clostridiales Family XIII bacterium]|jgi:hypothetical protein|nr:DUF5702 domain-containing protein [Clostridiales Family XIII bacterium]